MGESRHLVILVEDSEADVYLVREALKRAGDEFDLQVLDDGERAIEWIDQLDRDERAMCPSLVLLDLNLPRKTGDRVLERMRRSPRCGHIPVIVVTSSDSQADRAEMARLGATSYFRKPSRLDEFMRLGPLVRDVVRGNAVN